MAATDKIPIPGTAKRLPVLRIVRDKYPPTTQIQARILSVIVQQAFRVAGHPGDHYRIAQVVAMHDMHGQSKANRGFQGIGTNHVTAMDDSLCPEMDGFHHGSRQHGATIMTIGNDADFHP